MLLPLSLSPLEKGRDEEVEAVSSLGSRSAVLATKIPGATCWYRDRMEANDDECNDDASPTDAVTAAAAAAVSVSASLGVGAALALSTSDRTRSGSSVSGVESRRSALAQKTGGVRPLEFRVSSVQVHMY